MALDAGNVTSQFVEIPGEPTLAKVAGIPAVRVPLPLQVRPRSDFLTFLLVVAIGLLGLLLLSGAALLLFQAPGGKVPFLLILSSALFGAIGLATFPAAARYFFDLANSSPLLVVDERGVLDRPSMSSPLPWSEVESATMVYSRFGVAGFLLKLRRPVQVRRSPFRFGAWIYLLRRRRDEVMIPVAFVEQSYVVTQAILALLRRNGVVVLYPPTR